MRVNMPNPVEKVCTPNPDFIPHGYDRDNHVNQNSSKLRVVYQLTFSQPSRVPLYTSAVSRSFFPLPFSFRCQGRSGADMRRFRLEGLRALDLFTVVQLVAANNLVLPLTLKLYYHISLRAELN
jgi:hypothetical protein